MNECEWTRKVCRELEANGALVFAIVAQKMQAPGWPDRYVCHKSWQGFLEFKGVRTRLTLNQKLTIDSINKHGGKAFVVRMPGIVESTSGVVLGTFDNAKELLEMLVTAHLVRIGLGSPSREGRAAGR